MTDARAVQRWAKTNWRCWLAGTPLLLVPESVALACRSRSGAALSALPQMPLVSPVWRELDGEWRSEYLPAR